MANTRQKINVLSLSFEHSIFHEDEYALQDWDIISSNEPLLKHITDRVSQKQPHEVVLMLGDESQDQTTDARNTTKHILKGSSFDGLREVSTALSGRLKRDGLVQRVDPYLLADTYGILANAEASAPKQNDELRLSASYISSKSQAAVQAYKNRQLIESKVLYRDCNRLWEEAILLRPAFYGYHSSPPSKLEEKYHEAERSRAKSIEAFAANNLALALELQQQAVSLFAQAAADYSNVYEVNDFDLGDTLKHELDPARELREFNHATWFADDSKLTILYAQMHKAAADNPEASIVFDFYEGRHFVLESLNLFFKKNKELIPGNVTLCLHHYHGVDPVSFSPIKGKGGIDYSYHQNIRNMVKHAGYQYFRDDAGNAPTPKDITPDYPDIGVMAGFRERKNLRAFKKQRTLFDDTVRQYEASASRLGEFDPKVYLGGLKREIDAISDQENHHDFINTLRSLYDELEEDIITQVRKGVSPVTIQRSSAREVATNTQLFLRALTRANGQAARLAEVQHFSNYYQSRRRWGNFFKALAVVAVAAVGFVVGALAGVAVGVGVGALTGPGAVATGVFGIFAGASADTVVGVTAGAALTGVSAASVSGFLLFKADEKTKKLNAVMARAESYVASSAPSEMAQVMQSESTSSPVI